LQRLNESGAGPPPLCPGFLSLAFFWEIPMTKGGVGSADASLCSGYSPDVGSIAFHSVRFTWVLLAFATDFFLPADL